MIGDPTSDRGARELLEVQADVLERIVAARPLAEVLEALVRGIERLSEGMVASILLVEDGQLRHGAAPGLPDAYSAAIDGLEIGPAAGSCGTAAHRREAVVVEDVATDPLWADFRELAAEHGLAACWSTPVLAADGSVLGTFALYYHEPRAPTGHHVRLVETATHLCAVAIRADRDRRALAASEQRYRTLVADAPIGIFLTDPGGVGVYSNAELSRIVGRPAEELRGESWARHVHPDDRARVSREWAAAVEVGRAWSSEFRVVGADGTVRWIAGTGRPQRVDGQVTGFIGTCSDISLRRQAEALARAAAQRERLEDVFRQAPAAILVLRGPEHVVEFVNDACRAMLPARDIAMPVPVRDGWPELCGQGVVELLDSVYRTGEPYRGEAVPMRVDRHGDGRVEELFLDLLYAPLRAGDEVEGVVVHAVDVTDRVGARRALERALHTERRIAHTLQEALLPDELPAIPGIELAARYAPSPGQGWAVGGDFYDAFAVGDHRWLLVLGDVCGKGPEAAALTAMVRHTVRAEARHDSRPQHLLELVNEAIRSQLDELRFCTLVCAHLDLSDAARPRLEVSAGGNPAPILLHGDGSGEALVTRGTVLGVLADPMLGSRAVELAPGDTVVLYTDGLLDAGAPERIITPEELLAEARAASPAAAEELVGRLHERAIVDAPDPRDDIAILAARVVAPG